MMTAEKIQNTKTLQTLSEVNSAGAGSLVYMGVVNEANLGDQILLSQCSLQLPEYRIVTQPSGVWRVLCRYAARKALEQCSGYETRPNLN